ncbi:hypothetical protein [Nocardia aurantiaca]|uniref:Uncharacterized protein n=1 Tax=Nocardia aurantiaca TaxID=2675850 RepID=A0A6I3L966_9NOCA|nr:hypothetical protein [Nocardia aurantiaca]MTE16786.1 hypothetical protein [Nocardia aurantiaca]
MATDGAGRHDSDRRGSAAPARVAGRHVAVRSGPIRLELTSIDADHTEIRMFETFTHGIGRLLPDAVQAILLKPRNKESLIRLSDLITAEYRTGATGPPRG